MKKNAFSLCLAGTVLFGTVTTPALALSVDKLTDVSQSAWYYPYVQYVADKEYMVGVSENSFAPNMQVTRAMFVTTLAKLDGAAVSTAAIPFTDVPSNAWYSNAVKWAYERGIVAGVSATEFAPNATISREQMCVMMSAFLDYRAKQDNKTYKTTVAEKTFLDAASISTWAKDAVKESQMWGLVAGDENGNMNPQKAATRAEAAVMLKQLDAVLAAGVSNTTGGGSGGTPTGPDDDTTTTSRSYDVMVQMDSPSEEIGLILNAVVSATVNTDKDGKKTFTDDMTVSEVVRAMFADQQNTSAIDTAMGKVIEKIKAQSPITKTVQGKQVTITIGKDGVLSAEAVIKATDIVGSVDGKSRAATTVTQADVESLMNKLQAGGQISLTKQDVAALDKLVDKMGTLDTMSNQEIEGKIKEYAAGNTTLEQALQGMKADDVRQAANTYKEQLVGVQEQVKSATPGPDGSVSIPVEQPVAMSVSVDLSTYVDIADKQHKKATNKTKYVNKVELNLSADGSKKLTEDQKAALEAIYDLYAPSAMVSVSADGKVSLLTAAEYTKIAQAYANAVCDFYDSLNEDAAFYQSLLTRAENSDYSVSYSDGASKTLADLLGDQDGILVDENMSFRSDVDAVITVSADKASYDSLVELLTGQFDQAGSLLPTSVPSLVAGDYTVTLTIQQQEK